MADHEFFVGYLEPPPRTARFIRAVAIALLLMSAVLGAIVALVQSDPGSGIWADDVQEFTGILHAAPYPRLAEFDAVSITKSYLLLEEGKFGAQERARPHEGKVVRIRGRLVERGGLALIELIAADNAIEPTGDPFPRIAQRVPTSSVTLRGQIVDPKCFLGVMKPGEGKPHRACAALCILGGIPPVLVLDEPTGGAGACVLCDAGGRPLPPEDVIPFIAEPVEVRGALDMHPGGWPLLRIDPSAIQRRR